MAFPEISVLMSVFNGQDFVHEAIDSILGQTYSEFEFIIIDDASTDETSRILYSYNDPRLQIVPLKENIGLAGALNLGLGLARGEFIARMDADDIAYPHRLETQILTLRSFQDVVLLGSCYELIGKLGTTFGAQIVKLENVDLQSALLEGNQFCHSSVMMRREVALALGGYRSIAGRYAQDYDLWLRLSEHGKLMNLSEKLQMYRMHEGQVSVSKAMAQRTTAEFYRILARQRRVTGFESLLEAQRELDSKKKEIEILVAKDLLMFARNMELQGAYLTAYAIKWRAFLTDPLVFIRHLLPK